MHKDQALLFLQEHQPMPPDEQWTEELAEQYDNVRRYFINNPDPVCIPLFLHSYREGSGLGIYQLVDEVFEQFKTEEVILHLITALSSKHESVRYWTAQICMSFPDERLIKPIIEALNQSEEGTRYFCYCTLRFILEATQFDNANLIEQEIDKGFAKQKDKDLVEILVEIKEMIKKNRY